MASHQYRHIADPATNSSAFETHWGYATRILPCTNDAGSCAYLDAIYHMHDISMTYTFILWVVIGVILVIYSAVRFLKPTTRLNNKTAGLEGQRTTGVSSAYHRAWGAVQASMRRRLLPESFSFFGNVTRLQLLILAILSGYLVIFS
jgi:hypothetical protein